MRLTLCFPRLCFHCLPEKVKGFEADLREGECVGRSGCVSLPPAALADVLNYTGSSPSSKAARLRQIKDTFQDVSAGPASGKSTS